jgi:branched-subunit amino acid ABC-type transport system permease component
MGAPFYGVGLVMIFGHVAGMQTNLAAGSAMLFAAIAMFVLGHKIEGNLRSMAPVLLFRFLVVVVVLLSRRKVARYPFAKRVHLLRT